MDRMMEAIAGKGLAEKSEIWRLEKKYEGCEEALKNVTSVSHERMLPLHSAQGTTAVYTRSELIPPRNPHFSNNRLAQPNLARTQSELPEMKRPLTQPSFRNSEAPDITARDLTDEQLKRTYSYNNVYDARADRLPPMPLMEGFGKYRFACDASPAFKFQKTQEHLHDLAPLIGKLPNFALPGSSQDAVNRVRASARSSSFLSHRSSHSSSSVGVAEERVDPVTGTVISIGFGRSLSSSTTGSFKESFRHMRKDSGLSMSSLSGEGDNNLVRVPSRQSALRLALDSGSDSLAPIDEDMKMNTKQSRKAEKPCIFDAQGDMASALDSDTDEENVEISSDWVDATMDIRGSGALAKRLEQPQHKQNAPNPKGPKGLLREQNHGQPNARKEARHGVDRSRTIRPQVRPNMRRMISHHNQGQGRKNATNEKPITQTDQAEDAALHVSKDVKGEGEENMAHVGLYDADVREKTRLTATASKGDDADNDAGSLASDSTDATSVPAKPLRSRRNRSRTAIRVLSGNAGGNTTKPLN